MKRLFCLVLAAGALGLEPGALAQTAGGGVSSGPGGGGGGRGPTVLTNTSFALATPFTNTFGIPITVENLKASIWFSAVSGHYAELQITNYTTATLINEYTLSNQAPVTGTSGRVDIAISPFTVTNGQSFGFIAFTNGVDVLVLSQAQLVSAAIGAQGAQGPAGQNGTLTGSYAASAGNVTPAVGPYGGYVGLVHNGTNKWYTTPLAAFTNAVAGNDIINLQGINSETGTNLTCPEGLTVNFNGGTLTNGANGTGGSAFGLNDNVTINGPGYWVVNNDFSTTCWIGLQGTNPLYQIGATNWSVNNLNISGYSDCFYLWATNYFQGTIANCTLTGWGYDLLNEGQTNQPPSGVNWSGVIFNNDNFFNTAPYYQSGRGMLFENVSNTFNNCVWFADDTAYAMGWLAGVSTATNDTEIFNNDTFSAIGPTTANMISLHKNSRYTFNNGTMTVQASGSTILNIGASATGASNILSNVNCYGSAVPLIIGTASSYTWATGGNVTTAGTTPANFFMLPTLLNGNGSGVTNTSHLWTNGSATPFLANGTPKVVPDSGIVSLSATITNGETFFLTNVTSGDCAVMGPVVSTLPSAISVNGRITCSSGDTVEITNVTITAAPVILRCQFHAIR